MFLSIDSILTCHNPTGKSGIERHPRRENSGTSGGLQAHGRFDEGRMGGAITPDRFVALVYTDLTGPAK
jgi:hypothetical protein